MSSSSDEEDQPVKAKRVVSSTTSGRNSKATTPTAAAKSNGGAVKRKAAIANSSDEDIKPAKKRASLGGGASKRTGKGKAKIESDGYEDDDDGDALAKDEQDDDEEEMSPSSEDERPKKKPAAAAAKKASPAKKPPSKAGTSIAKGKAKAEHDGDEDMEEAKPAAKKWVPGQQRAGPSNPGSKVIPEGAPNCLGGLTIVFTGELESLGRDEATSLAKRYGAWVLFSIRGLFRLMFVHPLSKVTTSVSSKTNYVVLGTDAGPKKLETIKKNKIPTLDEDGFLRLIDTR